MARLTQEEIEQRDYEDAVRWQAEQDAAEARGEGVGRSRIDRLRRFAMFPLIFAGFGLIIAAFRGMN